jgi:hypothetical protein
MSLGETLRQTAPENYDPDSIETISKKMGLPIRLRREPGDPVSPSLLHFLFISYFLYLLNSAFYLFEKQKAKPKTTRTVKN